MGLSHKANLSKCKKIEFLQRIFSNHKGMELETNKRKTGMLENTGMLKQHTLKQPASQGQSKEIGRSVEHILPEPIDSVKAAFRGLKPVTQVGRGAS